MALRRVVGNLIKPRPIPPFTAATTTSARWIDGTAGGSATDLGYGWYTITGVGNIQYSITEDGVTLSATTNTGRGRVMTAPFESTTTQQNINQYGIPVTPNTSYTFSFKAKTVNNLANSARGQVVMFNSAGTATGGNISVSLTTGDSDWTEYSGTVTTGATASRGILRLVFETAGQIMSATFKDFKLDTTTPTTRTTATSRSTATNRVAVRDMGTSLSFAGGTDKVQKTAVLTDFATTPYSFSLWLNAPLVSTNTAGLANWIIGSNDVNASFRITLRNSLIQFRYFDADDDRTASTPQRPNRWVHIAATLDRSDKILRLYLNGTLVATGGAIANSITDLNTTTLSIGGGILTSLTGMMDEVRVWRNKTLTATEIQNLYLNNIVPQDGLVAEYLFDEATGTTAIDTSGNGNDGVISGCTYTTDTPLRPRTSV